MRILFFIFLCYSNWVSAQILDNTNGQTFGDKPFFNEEFIKRNKVKTIKGYYSHKADLDYIRESGDIYFYEFNENGQLVKDYRTQYNDTLISFYEYNAQGNLAAMRKSDAGGFYTYLFKYDEKGRIIEKEYRRDVNKSGNVNDFELDRSFVVSIDKFAYVDFEGKNFKKIYYNNIGKVYMEEFYYFNEFENLYIQETRMKMGSGRSKTTYEYDFKGRVNKKKVEKFTIGNYTYEWTYEYDEFDNLLAEHYYKNGEYLREHQIVYDEATYLLGAIIERDEPTNYVTILQFPDYTFFE